MVSTSKVASKICPSYFHTAFSDLFFKGNKDFDRDTDSTTGSENSTPSKRQKIDKGEYCMIVVSVLVRQVAFPHFNQTFLLIFVVFLCF